MQLTPNYSLLPWNTFGFNVKARYFAEYDTTDELLSLLAQFRGERLLHIGCGSNLLFLHDFDGVVLHSKITSTSYLPNMSDDENLYVRVGAGVVFDDFVAGCVLQGWGGAENLSYIPGEVGASAVQNIGAYGVEVKDIIHQVEAIRISDGEKRIFSNQECEYAYRDSCFKHSLAQQYIITHVVFHLHRPAQLHLDYGNLRTVLQSLTTPTIADVRRAIISIRQQKLPEVGKLGSAGSFFKNPVVSHEHFLHLKESYPTIPSYPASGGVKIPAAWLIDKLGFKGKTVGGAKVYELQPLVIVNTGSATPQDVQQLAADIQQKVLRKFAIHIEPEVNYID